MREKPAMSPDRPSPAPPFSIDCYPGHLLAENAFCSVLKTPWMLPKDTVFLYHTCTVSSRNVFKNKQINQQKRNYPRVNLLNRSSGRKWKALHPAGDFSALKDLTGSAAQEKGSDGQRRVGEQEGTRISAGCRIWGETVSSKNLSFETEIL